MAKERISELENLLIENPRIYKELLKLSSKKTTSLLFLLNGPKTLTDTSPRRYTDGKYMLHIICHRGNANENNDIPLHTYQKGQNLKHRQHQILEGNGAIRTLIHRWWECKLGQPLWKTVWQFLTKQNLFLPGNPTVVLFGIYPRS